MGEKKLTSTNILAKNQKKIDKLRFKWYYNYSYQEVFIINNNETKKKSNKIWITIGGIVVGIYIIGTVLFSFVCLPNTHVNGKNVSFAPKESVIGESVGDFDIKFKGLDDKELSFN